MAVLEKGRLTGGLSTPYVVILTTWDLVCRTAFLTLDIRIEFRDPPNH